MPVCFLDLDGVLVDFVTSALRVHGATLAMSEVQWEFPTQIGFARDDPKFWNVFGHDFWAGLAWTCEGRELLAGIEMLFGDSVVLLTSPCDTLGAVEGKIAWIRRELPRYGRRFFVGPPKHLIAGPDKILVDDCDGNADKFAAAGGKVVLIPRPWNRRKAELRGDEFVVGEILAELSAHL